MNRYLPFLFCLLFLANLPGFAAADTVSIHPSRDNTLFESVDGTTSNGSGPGFFVGDNSSSNTRRGVIAFDIAGTLAPGAVINSVELMLHLASVSQSSPGPATVELRRLTTSWGEGASSSGGGGGAPSQTDDATWIHRFYPDSSWASPGGDFDPDVRASTVVDTVGTYSWTDAKLAVDVQGWLDDPTSNHGWILTGAEGTPSSARRFNSRESEETTLRPLLIIDFTGELPVEPMTWGQLKRNWE